MAVLNTHSDVVHALPEYSQSGTYGERLHGRAGERLKGRATSTSLSTAEDQPTVKLTRDPDATNDKRGLAEPEETGLVERIPPLPEDEQNLKDWIEFTGVVVFCVGSVGYGIHRIFLYFTTDVSLKSLAFVGNITTNILYRRNDGPGFNA